MGQAGADTWKRRWKTLDERKDTAMVSLRKSPHLLCPTRLPYIRGKACWSTDGNQLYAGRRNGAVDVWDVRQLGYSGTLSTPRLLKTLRNPTSSGVVSCVVAFPDCRHIAWYVVSSPESRSFSPVSRDSASVDNLRLWNVAESVEQDNMSRAKGVQFKIIPGHHGGYVSQMSMYKVLDVARYNLTIAQSLMLVHVFWSVPAATEVGTVNQRKPFLYMI